MNADLPICEFDLSPLRRRGPDFSSFSLVQVPDSSETFLAIGCVLSIRGRKPRRQPIHDSFSDLSPPKILLWNGEVFDCTSTELSSMFHNPEINDAELLFSWFLDDLSSESLFQKLASLRGPFAFILVQVSDWNLASDLICSYLHLINLLCKEQNFGD